MADTTFVDRVTPIQATWLNDVNDHVYNGKVFDPYAPVFVKDPTYGVVGDGVTDDYAAIAAIFSAGHKTIVFTEGTYHLGDWATSARIFDLTTRGDNINLITNGDVEFTVNTTASANPVVFYLRSNNHFYAGKMRFRDLNYSRTSDRGLIGFTLDAFSADWENVTIDSIYAKNCYTAFVCATQSATRVRNIHIKTLSAIDCNRGANFQNQGDGVVIDLLYAERVERAYFAYGVTGHKINIFTRENYGTTGSVNIARTVGGYDTSALDITYTSRDNTVDLCHVLINHIDLLGGEISGIKVHVDIRGSTAYDPVRIVNYTGSGGSETSSASSNYVSDIELSGSCDAQARDVEVVASFAAVRRLTFNSGRYFEFDDSVPANFLLAGGGLYTPVTAAWTAVTANPSIGNGTFSRNHTIVGNICFVNYNLALGSTTTTGTGDWIFSAPVAAAQTAQGAAYLLDSGTATFVGTARITAGSSEIKIYPDNSATAVRSNTPFTWTTNDQLAFSLAYPVS